MCGEQVNVPPAVSACPGSPPRVRGTGPEKELSKCTARITPACAGNSIRFSSRCPLMWDHPRVCGEQTNSKRLYLRWRGSPPRVRGTAVSCAACREGGRITPACAGNSSFSSPPTNAVEDHPRVCGEQFALTFTTTESLGSPPRVRGTGFSPACPRRFCRITPACAGNRHGQ